MIRLKGLRKTYRSAKVTNEVLRDVDLEIADGELVSVVGPSGSGKTTLLHAVGGLDTDYEGDVFVDGKNLRKLDDAALSTYRNRDVGFVFQSFYLLPHLTCQENVALPALFARGDDALSHRAALKRASEVLTQVDLADKIDARPTTLSGGQRQRVAIARALFNRPKLMLCDEPTGNLDSVMGKTIIELFRTLNETEKITMIIVTHDPSVSALTPRTIVCRDGKLVDELVASTTEVTAAQEVGR
jgi:putative ABC transport system ATP-binding protein